MILTERKVKILSAGVMIVIMVLFAFSGTVTQARSISNSSSSTNYSSLATGLANLSYLVESGPNDTIIQSANYISGDSVITTTSLFVNDQVVSTSSSSTDLTLQSLEFSVGASNTSFSNSMSKGEWKLTKLVKGNKDGLVSYASVTVKNEILDINKTLSVYLERATLCNGLNFNTFTQKGLYLFFVPQLISPTTNSTMSIVNSGRLLAPSSNNGNCLRLTELDNTLANYHVWHLQTNLSAWSPTYGGYSDSYAAEATFVNWWLESTSISTSVSVGYQIEACANAFFYGIFPLGDLDLWYAYPQVNVTATFNNQGVVTSGTINDPIYVESTTLPLLYFLWSDVKVNINSFSGYKDVQEYIIDG